MAGQVKKVLIADLKVGMNVEDVFNDKGYLLFSANTRINDLTQISRLKKQGVRSVFVRFEDESGDDTSPYIPSPPIEKKDEGGYSSSQYRRELARARDTYAITVNRVHETMRSARFGRAFSTSPIEATAESFLRVIDRNPNILITMSQIKRYNYDTYVHSINVGILIGAFAAAIGYTGEALRDSCFGGILHDIGKMRIPESLLNKAGRYSRQELDMMKRHPEYGIQILQANHALSDVSNKIVSYHHERFNGSGYPSQLKGSDIAEIAYVAGLADMYDAMTTQRPHRPAYLPQEALALIFQASDELFPRIMVEQFAKLIGIYPVGSFVKLESGEMGIVVHVKSDQLLKPVVLLLFNSYGDRIDEPFEIDLSLTSTNEGVHAPSIDISLNPAQYNVDPGLCLQKMLLQPV